MIQLCQGDILQSSADALVNTVNCVGVMGAGLALQFKRAYPEMFSGYTAACGQGRIELGDVWVYWLSRPPARPPHCIVGFPTKHHWRGQSKIENIESGLAALTEFVYQLDIGSIAIPPLGCGLGGLAWNDVRPLIEKAFEGLPDVEVLLFEPRKCGVWEGK